MVKVGFVGAGYISDAHARAVHANLGTVPYALFDVSRARAETLARTHRIPHPCTSMQQFLETGVEAVHILSPPDSHYELARQIILARRHVFIEKPMAVTAKECRELVELARERGVTLGVNHNFLFLRSYDRLRRELQNGRIGRIDQVTINWLYVLGLIKFGPYNNWMLREPQNLFLEIGSHLCAFALDIAGEAQKLEVSVSRELQIPGGATVFRRWHVHALAGDTAVDINLSLSPGQEDRSLSIRGYGGIAHLDYSRDVLTLDLPTGAGVHFDALVSAERYAFQMMRAGVRNFATSMVGKMRKSPEASFFLHSIERSVAAFYRSIDGETDSRIDGEFATRVIAMCESVAAQLPAQALRTAAVITPEPVRPTVLVLGGTGFIGKYLVRRLVQNGLGVRVASRSRSSAQLALEGLPVEIVEGDLTDAAFVTRALEGIDVVFHLAKVEAKKWSDYYEQDVQATCRLGETALAAGVKRFIYTGTIDSYYSANGNEIITEATPLDPRLGQRNFYARSKAACERALMRLHREKGLPVVVLRPGIVIGKGCPPSHWGIGSFESDSRVSYWGTGSNLLPLVLVEDVAEALILAMRGGDDVVGKAFLLADKPMLNAREYVDILSREIGTRIRAKTMPIWRHFLSDWLKELVKNLVRHPNRRIPSYRDWDSRSHRARYDSRVTQQVLGWKPAGDRQALIERGIVEPVREFIL
jgi:nucleoside-diphosphate-sugar epimerase/predicted dehydrogenase